MATKNVNVSIVTYKTKDDDLHRCLKSLLGCELVRHVDVIDNGQEDRIERLCGEYDDRVRYRSNPNVGFGSAHNIAMRATLSSDVPYHLVINADVYFAPGNLERCVEYMESHPECGQLIPRVNFPDGAFQSVCHPLPKPAELILHRFTPWGWNVKRIIRYELRDRDLLSQPRNVPIHHGCFMLLRADALREVGLFDERFFMYAEDFDLTRRMHRQYETIFFPGAEVVHIFCGGSRRQPRLFWIHCKSMMKYFWKWGFVFDKERRYFNRRLFSSIPLIPGGRWI